MKAAIIVFALFALCSCGSTRSERPIVRFYQEALKRSRNHERVPPANATGLQVKLGWIPGAKRYAGGTEDSIVISDPDPKETQVVLIIVEPRVSGSFLDPEEPSDDFVRMLETNARFALRNSRCRVVELLPKR